MRHGDHLRSPPIRPVVRAKVDTLGGELIALAKQLDSPSRPAREAVA